MLNVKQCLKDILYRFGIIADYVVEVGQDGIWTYEKRASGIAECWGTITCDAMEASQEGAGYWRSIAYPFPTNLFAEIPNITYGWQRNFIGGFNLSSGTTKDKFSGYVWGFVPSALSGTQYLNIQAKGRWK